jgi:hypothetical protein
LNSIWEITHFCEVFQGKPFDTQGKSKVLLRHLNTGRLMAFNADNMPVLRDYIDPDSSSPLKDKKSNPSLPSIQEITTGAFGKKRLELPFDPASVGGNDEDEEFSEDSLGIEKKPPKKKKGESEEEFVDSDFGDDEEDQNLAKATLKMDPSNAQKSKQTDTMQEKNNLPSEKNIRDNGNSPRKGSMQVPENKQGRSAQAKSNVQMPPVQKVTPREQKPPVPEDNSNPVKRIKLLGNKKKDKNPLGDGEYKKDSGRDWEFGNDGDDKGKADPRSPKPLNLGGKEKTSSVISGSKKSNITSREEEKKDNPGRIKYPNLNDKGLISDPSET